MNFRSSWIKTIAISSISRSQAITEASPWALIIFDFFVICVIFVYSRKGSINYADLGVQLDVFDEQRENDESQILDVPFRGVDINSHVDVFYAILKQVS